MDECDRGKVAESKYLGGAIAERRAEANSGGQIFEFCQDCGEEIDPDRRANAISNGRPCERCFACQTKLEEKNECL